MLVRRTSVHNQLLQPSIFLIDRRNKINSIFQWNAIDSVIVREQQKTGSIELVEFVSPLEKYQQNVEKSTLQQKGVLPSFKREQRF